METSTAQSYIATVLRFLSILNYILNDAQHFILVFNFWQLLDFEPMILDNCPRWFWHLSTEW